MYDFEGDGLAFARGQDIFLNNDVKWLGEYGKGIVS